MVGDVKKGSEIKTEEMQIINICGSVLQRWREKKAKKSRSRWENTRKKLYEKIDVKR